MAIPEGSDVSLSRWAHNEWMVKAMSERWGICPRCRTGPPAEPLPGVTRWVRLRCSNCGQMFSRQEPDPGGLKPNYLAMRAALRPLVAELDDLALRLAARDPELPVIPLVRDIDEALVTADDEGRLLWLRQQARIELGDEPEPDGPRGVMMADEEANMRELIASRPARVVPAPKPAKPPRTIDCTACGSAVEYRSLVPSRCPCGAKLLTDPDIRALVEVCRQAEMYVACDLPDGLGAELRAAIARVEGRTKEEA